MLSARALDPTDLLHRRYSVLGSLSDADRRVLAALPPQRRSHVAGDDLGAEGEVQRFPRLIISGWAARTRSLSDGRRQIIALLVPGDSLGLCSRPNPLALAGTVTLTRMETTDLAPLAAVLKAGAPEHRGLVGAVLVSAALEEAGLLDQVVRLGRQTALERTAHLLLELRWRLALAGLAADRRFPMPLTQEMLADTLGLSVVHVNRTLQTLRRDRLIRAHAGQVELLDPERLALVADFTPPRPTADLSLEMSRQAWPPAAAVA